MTIIVFLIDTSASMNQRTYFGPSFLDLAKGAVETFLKFRSRDPSSRGVDRYMLLTFDESPKNIKAGWKENQATFMQELRSLKASGLTTMGTALGNAFHLLNVNRLMSGVDYFGYGRYPNYLEPAVILLITDGGALTNPSGIAKELEVPTSILPGCELYKEPFRWDQRIFALVLRMPGHAPKNVPSVSLIPQDVGPLESMCDATGGRSYTLTTLKMLNHCLESLVQKVQTGVVINWEKFGPDPPPIVQDENKLIVENGFVQQTNNKLNLPNHVTTATTTETATIRKDNETPEPSWHKTRKMFYVLRAAGRGVVVSHWPIPEPFWPDPSSNTLPSRNAHPVIKFKCDHSDPLLFNELPFDKYELEPSPLTQYILERKQPSSCWQVFIECNGKYGDIGHPFGYLKASSTLTCVNLFVFPYNYPTLVPLLDELKNSLKGKPSQIWRSKFEKYIRSVPPYYCVPLRKLLSKNGFNVMPEGVENFLSYNVSSYLNKVKHNGREEFNKLCQNVGQSSTNIHLGIKVIPRTSKSLVQTENKNSSGVDALKLDANEFNGFRILLKPPSSSQPAFVSTSGAKLSSEFRNPFDIPRAKLLHQLAKMRINLEQHITSSSIPVLEGGLPGTSLKLQNAEELHSLPVAQMGNYQDYLKLMPQPLKPIETLPIRQHAFGNPFKVDKRMLVDEADLDVIVSSGNSPSTSASLNSPSNRHIKKYDSTSNHTSKSIHGNAPKRKAGPLPRDFRYLRSRSRSRSESSDESSVQSPLSIDEDNSSMSDLSDVESVTSDVSMNDRVGEDFDSTPSSSEAFDEKPSPSFAENENYLTTDDDERPSTSVTPDIAPSTPPVAKRPKLEKQTNSEHFDPKLLPDMKRTLARLIRKPGKDYQPIFQIIDDSPSPLFRNFLLNWSYDESLRLKRTALCEKLKTFMNKPSLNSASSSSSSAKTKTGKCLKQPRR